MNRKFKSIAILIIILTISLLELLSCSIKKEKGAKTEKHLLQLQGLKSYINNTSYTGLLKFKSIQKINSNQVEDTYIISANVMETFTENDKYKDIVFEMTTEKGDSIYFKEKTFIISLCLIEGTFYWAGTGSEFESTPFLIEQARVFSKQKKNNNSSFCD